MSIQDDSERQRGLQGCYRGSIDGREHVRSGRPGTKYVAAGETQIQGTETLETTATSRACQIIVTRTAKTQYASHATQSRIRPWTRGCHQCLHQQTPKDQARPPNSVLGLRTPDPRVSAALTPKSPPPRAITMAGTAALQKSQPGHGSPNQGAGICLPQHSKNESQDQYQTSATSP